jgi:hypothetical protein
MIAKRAEATLVKFVNAKEKSPSSWYLPVIHSRCTGPPARGVHGPN